MRKYPFALIFILTALQISAQSGGNNTYDFLNLTNSARVASLGGQQISLYGDDLNVVYHNPSLLNPSMSNHLVMNYINYIADINYGYVSYARTIKNYGNFGAGIHYINYGDFQYADVEGNRNGIFHAKDYSFNLYYSHPILDSLFMVGATLKGINSEYESLNSWGIAMDAGITYNDAKNQFTAAFVMKNLGMQLNTYYYHAPHEPLPFELQLGITKKLLHAPFRFSILAQHLETPNLLYQTEADKKNQVDLLTGQTNQKSKLADFGDNLMRHIVFGLEFVPSKNFNINIGYNYKRRQELKIQNNSGMTGFSWGFGFRVYNFHFSFARVRYHISSVSNHFSLEVNLNEFSRKFQ